MARRPRTQPSIPDLVALSHVLEQDEMRGHDEVMARDRRLVTGLSPTMDQQPALPLAWLDAVTAENPEAEATRERASNALQWAGFFMALLGVITGVVVALGAFYYSGGSRVNVVGVLGVLVLLPGVLLLPFILAVVPSRWLAWLPGAHAARSMVRGVSPGRLGFVVARFLPSTLRDTLGRVAANAAAQQTLHARIQKWTLARWSQIYALAFQLAALATALGLVAFTDLVFGWSTTLSSGDAATDAVSMHEIVRAAAAPWSWVVEGATPTAALIAESRYYRVATDPVTVAQATRLGGWWPFVVLAMFTYGLVPRVITFTIATVRLQAALRTAFTLAPGVGALVRRLHALRVQTTGATTDAPSQPGSGSVDTTVDGTAIEATATAAIINWSGVPWSGMEIRKTLGDAPVFAAGGSTSIDEDRKLATQLASLPMPAGAEVAILVKAWEPPLLEFVDFLQALRRTLDRGRVVTVYPVPMDGSDGSLPGPVTLPHLEVWRRRLQRVGDPWLRVVPLSKETPP